MDTITQIIKIDNVVMVWKGFTVIKTGLKHTRYQKDFI